MLTDNLTVLLAVDVPQPPWRGSVGGERGDEEAESAISQWLRSWRERRLRGPLRYKEAAFQGLYAGINAALQVKGAPPLRG